MDVGQELPMRGMGVWAVVARKIVTGRFLVSAGHYRNLRESAFGCWAEVVA